MLLTWLLVRGMKESAKNQQLMLLTQIAAILLFVVGAAAPFNSPTGIRFPQRISGVLTGGAIVFFSLYTSDSIPFRPRRRSATVLSATCPPASCLPAPARFSYSAVAGVTGIARWDTLNNDASVANALKRAIGFNRLSVLQLPWAPPRHDLPLLVSQYGQARIWFPCRATGCSLRRFRASIPTTGRRMSDLDRRGRGRDPRRDLGTSALGDL